jgi:pyrrolysine biosynthesis protein PylC
MLVAVIGGNLQGVEATYLAQRAGWEVLLIDKVADVPASGLCDQFIQFDVASTADIGDLLRGVGLIFPALEDHDALTSLKKCADLTGIPMAFDPDAYAISSSKRRSDQLFARIGVPAPKPWPGCGFPVVVKPDHASGSAGVQVIRCARDLMAAFPRKEMAGRRVMQAYVDGPSYSIEVMGAPGHYRAIQVTDLGMDAVYDCKRVTAPTVLGANHVRTFEQIGLAIAEAVQLKGLMDVEVILHDGELKVLEIDARIPSQTPTAVYWSTGVNMVRLLGELFTRGTLRVSPDHPPRGVIYEHVRVSRDGVETAGEHVMSHVGPLHIRRNFFGADEAITNFHPGRCEWVATLIFSGRTREALAARRAKTFEQIRERSKPSGGSAAMTEDIRPPAEEAWG